MSAINSYLATIASFGENTPDKVMIVDRDGQRHTTCREFCDTVAAIAVAIDDAIGIGDGEADGRVFIPVVLPDGMEYIASLMAVWATGHACVFLSTEFPWRRVEYAINHTRASLVIDEDFIREKVVAANNARLCRRMTAVGRADTDRCALFYTSGSTGEPKGVLHSDKSFAGGVERFLTFNRIGGYKSFFGAPPCFFVAVNDTLAAISSGLCAHFLTPDAKRDVLRLERYLADHAIEVAVLPPSLLKVFHSRSKALRYVLSLGERMTNCYSADYTIVNGLGQTELAGGICYKTVDRGYANTPIGRNVEGTEVAVVDDEGQPVAEGEEGEMVITAGVTAPEYFRNEEATAELTRGGVIHTGDIVRRLPNGEYLFVQRKGWMLKINGQRVEPGEVEEVARRMDGVGDVVVKGFTTADHSRQYIVLYYIPSSIAEDSGDAVDGESIRAYLSQRLPHYMVPLHYIRMSAFPRTPNGKTDRKALAAPGETRSSSPYVSPTTDLERELCDAFAKVLAVERVGIDDDFFSLGGDSIRLMQVQTYLTSEVPSSVVYHGGTPRKIAAQYEAMTHLAADQYDGLRYELTDIQKVNYRHSVDNPDRYIEHLASVNTFRKDCHCGVPPVDAQRLCRAIETVVDAHPSLKLQIMLDGDGEPYAIDASDKEWHVSLENVTDEEYETISAQLLPRIDFVGHYLFFIRVFDTPTAVHFFMDFHHIVFDGLSEDVFLRDVGRAYDGLPVERESVTIYDILREKQLLRDMPPYKEAKWWFRKELKGMADIAAPRVKGEMATMERRLDIPCRKELEAMCTAKGITPNVLFMAAMALAIGSHRGLDKTLLHTYFHARVTQDRQNVVGSLATVRLCALRWQPWQEVDEYLMSCKEHLLGNFNRTSYPFTEAMDDNNIAYYHPIFIYEGGIGSHRLQLGGVVGEASSILKHPKRLSQMRLFVYDHGEGYRFIGIHAPEYVDDDAMCDILSRFESILRHVATADRVEQLCPMTPAVQG